MNRIEVRNYYRESSGLLCLLNALCILTVSGLAIYVSDFSELDVEEGNGVLALNVLYAIFFVGLIFALMYLIAGCVALKSQSEGIFSFNRFVSVIMLVMMLLSIADSLYVIWNKEVVWTAERRWMLAIMLVVSLLSAALCVWITMLAFRALKYYDRGKKFAKSADEIKEEQIVSARVAASLFCTGILNLALTMLCFYFAEAIKEYDSYFHEGHAVYRTLLWVLFVVGLLVFVDTMFVTVVSMIGKMEKLSMLRRLSCTENFIYIGLFVVMGIALIPQKFTASKYPDVAYLVFGFILAIFALAYLIGAIRYQKRKNK